MAKTKQSRIGASMFSKSSNMELQGSEFNTIGRDRNTGPTVNITVNVPVPQGQPGSDQALNNFVPPEEDFPKGHTPTADASPSPNPFSKSSIWRPGSWLPSRLKRHPIWEETPIHQTAAYDADTPPLTPGSSCASSPFSSQEDLGLSSAQNLDSQFLQSENLTTSEEYVRSMSKTGNGLPVYLPKPVKPYGDVRVGVVPGDVGTYNPIGLPAREVSVDEQVIPEGHVLSEGASSRKLRSRSQKSMVSSFEHFSSVGSS
ncbi:hypothetical protein FA13DRAFT_592360 [Coprinellus micaceus]|uniref:Uncharacterized protein n=1 Tax=Coprinellus micaceus TaxID=71717 RepID=A0A4Y7SAZ0_COPMI|nr:hypothetical protein FA13DRAFT_592360 [Coprinellus micaceus]